MAVTPVVLIAAKNVEASQTTQYTVPDGVTTIIDKFTVTNYDTAVRTISVNIVASGGSTGNDNLIIKSKSIQASECYNFPELVGMVLTAGMFISTIASSATKLNMRASGREVT